MSARSMLACGLTKCSSDWIECSSACCSTRFARMADVIVIFFASRACARLRISLGEDTAQGCDHFIGKLIAIMLISLALICISVILLRVILLSVILLLKMTFVVVTRAVIFCSASCSMIRGLRRRIGIRGGRGMDARRRQRVALSPRACPL